MGMFDKFMFWKRKEDLGDNLALPEKLPPDIGATPADELQGMPQPQQYPQPTFQPRMESFQQQQGFRHDRDMELIAAKLDAISARLQSIEQRIANLESIAYGEQQPTGYRYRGKW